MRKIKLPASIFLAMVIFAVVVTGVVGLMLNARHTQRKTKEVILDKITCALKDYPSLTAEYNYGIFYSKDGCNEYLILQSESSRATAVRTSDGVTLYYIAGKVWKIANGNKLVEMGVAADPVADVAKNLVIRLLSDADATYTFHKASGLPLPLWVYPEEEYIQCTRLGYANCIEVMVYKEANEGSYIRWTILRTQEDVSLFLELHNSSLTPTSASITYIPGWGDLPEVISAAVFG